MRLAVIEQQLRSRVFALALDPYFDARAASRELVELARGNRRAMERVFERVQAVADPRGQVTARVLAALGTALEAMPGPGATAAPAGPPHPPAPLQTA